MHNSDVVELSTSLYVPAGHAWQEEVPEVRLLYLPTAQEVHTALVDAVASLL